MRKKQRGFRLDQRVMDDIDDHCLRMGTTYNAVIQTCIAVAFPIVDSHEFYAARLNGVTVEKMAEACRKVIAGMAKGL